MFRDYLSPSARTAFDNLPESGLYRRAYKYTCAFLDALASIDRAHFQTMQLDSLPSGVLLLHWPGLRMAIGGAGSGCNFIVLHVAKKDFSNQWAGFTTAEHDVGDVVAYVHERLCAHVPARAEYVARYERDRKWVLVAMSIVALVTTVFLAVLATILFRAGLR